MSDILRGLVVAVAGAIAVFVTRKGIATLVLVSLLSVAACSTSARSSAPSQKEPRSVALLREVKAEAKTLTHEANALKAEMDSVLAEARRLWGDPRFALYEPEIEGFVVALMKRDAATAREHLELLDAMAATAEDQALVRAGFRMQGRLIKAMRRAGKFDEGLERLREQFQEARAIALVEVARGLSPEDYARVLALGADVNEELERLGATLERIVRPE